MTASELPDDLPVVERNVIRLVVVDTAGAVLLFRTHDPTYPELGAWWELPGGGLEPGETYIDCALRELREEAGITVDPWQVDEPNWRRTASFRYRGERRLQTEDIAAVRLIGRGPAVDGSGRVGFEAEDYFGFRWWAVAEIRTSPERFYPRRLPELLPAFLAGQQIDEPLEVWS